MSKYPHLEGIPVLTVKQPFAALIMFRYFDSLMKDIENRKWGTEYRGPILICASARPKFNLYSARKECWCIGLNTRDTPLEDWIEAYPAMVASGALIGTVSIESVFEDCGYSPWCIEGCQHWKLSDPQPFEVAIPYKGHLGLRPFDLARVKEDET